MKPFESRRIEETAEVIVINDDQPEVTGQPEFAIQEVNRHPEVFAIDDDQP